MRNCEVFQQHSNDLLHLKQHNFRWASVLHIQICYLLSVAKFRTQTSSNSISTRPEMHLVRKRPPLHRPNIWLSCSHSELHNFFFHFNKCHFSRSIFNNVKPFGVTWERYSEKDIESNVNIIWSKWTFILCFCSSSLSYMQNQTNHKKENTVFLFHSTTLQTMIHLANSYNKTESIQNSI